MDRYHIYKTPVQFDDIILKSDGNMLTGLFFMRDGSIPDVSESEEREEFREAINWLEIYFRGEIPDFTPRYRMTDLTPFRKEVCDILMTVPYGKCTTYGEIAEMIAKKRNIPRMSAQAVGNALHENPVCIIIPCHRVIGKNGKLTGYGGGLRNKEELLKLEKAEV